MSEQVFGVSEAPLLEARPHIELLQWLARGSLKQNLLRAIRLWVWLRSLYGDDNRLWLSDTFTFAEWRDIFFSATHLKGEAVPHLHDRDCACAKTTAEWLFNVNGVSELEWRQSLQQHDSITDAKLDNLLQRRLFAVTRRSLFADLQILTQLGWIDRRGQHYQRVRDFPAFPAVRNSESIDVRRSDSFADAGGDRALNFLHPDLAAIAQSHSQQVEGIQRFFLQLDYIIPATTLDRVDDWQDKLRHLWQQTPVPPIQLTYNSARLGYAVDCIVYPVCIYYIRRAVYLCAFGGDPAQKGEWYNYRLDRIQKMTALEWTSDIPQILQQRQANLPSPEYIEIEMADAWGFDFYLPAKSMLLRFDRDFHDRYIQGTFRHETFQPQTFKQAEQLIRQHASPPEQQALLAVLQSRSRQDAYYHVRYRDGDRDVEMRLRAWRPKGEVLMPYSLRQKIAKEVAIEFQLYLKLSSKDVPPERLY